MYRNNGHTDHQRMTDLTFLFILLLGALQKTRALSEDYTTVTGGFSGKNDDAKSRANCPAGYLLTGCTLTKWYKTDGRRVNDDLSHGCIGQNGDGGNGLRVSYLKSTVLVDNLN